HRSSFRMLRRRGTSTSGACSSERRITRSRGMRIHSGSGALVGLVVLALAAACGPTPSATSPAAGGAQQPSPPAPPRTLEMAIQVEPSGVASRALVERGVALHVTKRAFNADLVLLDDREV